MSPAVIKLESFTASLPGKRGGAGFTRDDLDLAYADGLADGRSQRQDEDVQSLRSGLERLAEALAADEARRAALREEAVQALAPVLSAILDMLVPSAQSRRMEEALLAELRRLAGLTAPLRCRIACNPGLRGMVERCLQEAGLDQVELEGCDSDRISLSLEGGRIEFSPDRVAQDIRALVAEITESEETWTH